MTIKKLVRKLHLYLGLVSGIIVFVVAITGCIYVFQKEIQDLTQPYRFVTPQDAQFLPPSVLYETVEKKFPEKTVSYTYYYPRDHAAVVVLYGNNPDLYYDFVYINPYTAEILRVKDMTMDFFTIVMNLHYRLLLPLEIGTTIVDYATLIFFIMMVTGIFLWWPRSKKSAKQRFRIKWQAKWRRKNYDLHNVLGFYMTWIAIFISFTGLLWGFEWISEPVYTVLSGGKEKIEYYTPQSDTTNAAKGFEYTNVDKLWERVVKEASYPDNSGIFYPAENFPPSVITIYTNPDNETFYKREYRFFDKYTLEELPVNHIWANYQKANAGDMLERIAYDVHVGSILGLPGKFLAFFGSLVAASLPITGFMVWRGRKKKKQSKPD